MASYWPTLGQYVEGLEQAGKLVRVTVPINKDTELHPLVRLQFRGLPESQRKAFLFENVTDARGRSYDIPVLVGAMAGSGRSTRWAGAARSRKSPRSGAARWRSRSRRCRSRRRRARKW